jgi:hypothetical protein
MAKSERAVKARAPIVNGIYLFVKGTFFFQSTRNIALVKISPFAAYDVYLIIFSEF